MIWVDYSILSIIAISALISVFRGFVREVMSLMAWVLAIWLALRFSNPLAAQLTVYIATPSVRIVIAFAVVFIASLLVGALVSYGVAKLVKGTGLTGTDRALGVIFGVARGVAIVAILILLAGLTPLPRDPWWRESVFIGHFQEAAIWIRDLLPKDYARHFNFDADAQSQVAGPRRGLAECAESSALLPTVT